MSVVTKAVNPYVHVIYFYKFARMLSKRLSTVLLRAQVSKFEVKNKFHLFWSNMTEYGTNEALMHCTSKTLV